ncbi:unnamed protein product [Rodentolepis nana]|uniref:PIK helical domain-containing protein n=1 Tax=Rodentolepis nana TaxID=102285 RepID=A0A0R3T2G0_RODNA|nr:unnamed protein product [Rodentolepis nana]
MEGHLNAILYYLKCLQYLHLKVSNESLNSKPIEEFVVKSSQALASLPEHQKLSIKTFLSDHSELFPHLDVERLEELALDSANLSSRSSPFKNVPFFFEASHLASKANKPRDEIFYYMDWCWELNQEAFIKLMLEILEIGDPTLTDVSISWIIEALKIDDRVLFEFTKFSCGRIRDICVLYPEFSSEFISSLQVIYERSGCVEEPHCLNLERHIKSLRLAGLIPS